MGLAQRLGIKIKEMGPPLNDMGVFEGQEALITLFFEKLHHFLQNYLNSQDFHVSPMTNQDVIPSTPWFHKMYPQN